MTNSISDTAIRWLLEKENPSVRYFALTTLLGKPMLDPEVIEARKAIMEYGAVPKILNRQKEGGYWSEPDRFYRDKYKGTVWVLLMLAELGADPGDPRIRNACEFILENSQDKESGGFSVDRSAKLGGGLPSGVIPCLTGNMVYSLVKLGYLGDSRVQRAIGWIGRYQRADDGIQAKPEGAYYDRFEMCFGKHTCHMGAAKALKALAAIPAETRSPETVAKIGELTEYFLLHHLYKKSHSLAEVSRPGWLRLGFPLMYQTDILELLGIMKDLGIKDPRLDDAAEILRNKQMPDGRWKLENTFNDRTIVSIEAKGMPSRWITLRALQVLSE